MIQNEMAIEQHGLHFGQEVVAPVEVTPARLHQSHPGVGEVMDGAHEEVGGRAEIGVEYRDQLAGGRFETGLQGAGFVADTVRTMMILDAVSEGPVALY